MYHILYYVYRCIYIVKGKQNYNGFNTFIVKPCWISERGWADVTQLISSFDKSVFWIADTTSLFFLKYMLYILHQINTKLAILVLFILNAIVILVLSNINVFMFVPEI